MPRTPRDPARPIPTRPIPTRPIPTRQLPARPSLESLKKQAKALLRSQQRGDAEAAARVRAADPRPDAFRSLRDAQLVIAREYGLAGWEELCGEVERRILEALPFEERAAKFSDLACIFGARTDDPRHVASAVAMLEREPDLARADVYAAAAACDTGALRDILASNSDCVQQPGGPRDWLPMLYLTYSRVPEDVAKGDSLECLRLLLDAGADPNAHALLNDRYRFTAMTGAIGEGEQGVERQPPHPRARGLVVALLDAGADPNDAQGLYNSVFTPGNEWLELLLGSGLDAEARVDWRDPEGKFSEDGVDDGRPMRTVDFQLGQAVVRGFEDRVALLLEHGADPNTVDPYGGRSHYEGALLLGHTAIAERLRANGAAPERFGDQDRFQAACMAGDLGTAQSMLRATPSLIENASLLPTAAQYGSDVGFETVLQLGADIDGVGEDGRTALHHLVPDQPIEKVRSLVLRGAALDVREPTFDATPIGFADHAGRVDVASLLLDHSTDVFDLATWGRALQLGAVLDSDPAVATCRRAWGATPLHGLLTAGDDGREVIRLLCAHGADIDARSEAGYSPLETAIANERDEVADLLRQAGAEEPT